VQELLPHMNENSTNYLRREYIELAAQLSWEQRFGKCGNSRWL